MRLHGPPFAHRIHFLVGLPLDVHARRVDTEKFRQSQAHGVLEGADLRPLENDRQVDVGDSVTRGSNPGGGLPEENGGIRVFPFRRGIGKQFADVRFAECPQQCISDRMEPRIAVTVPDRTAIMVQPHSAQDQRSRAALSPAVVRGDRLKSMEVVPVSDSV